MTSLSVKFISLYLISLVFSYSLNTWAQQDYEKPLYDCEVTLYNLIPYSPLLSESDLVDTYTERVSTWQSCMYTAVAIADTIPPTGKAEATTKIRKFFGLPAKVVTTFSYAEWKFKKGLLLPAKGQVTVYTPFYIDEPEKGDVRVHRNGESFED